MGRARRFIMGARYAQGSSFVYLVYTPRLFSCTGCHGKGDGSPQTQWTCLVCHGSWQKKYIYEFLIELKWEFVHDSEMASGSMSFPDFDGTCEIGEGYEMLNYHVDPETPSALRPVLDRFIKNDGLRDALHDTLDDWVRLFKETYESIVQW